MLGNSFANCRSDIPLDVKPSPGPFWLKISPERRR